MWMNEQTEKKLKWNHGLNLNFIDDRNSPEFHFIDKCDNNTLNNFLTNSKNFPIDSRLTAILTDFFFFTFDLGWTNYFDCRESSSSDRVYSFVFEIRLTNSLSDIEFVYTQKVAPNWKIKLRTRHTLNEGSRQQAAGSTKREWEEKKIPTRVYWTIVYLGVYRNLCLFVMVVCVWTSILTIKFIR